MLKKYQAKCEVCGHTAAEHSNQGCLHIEYSGKPPNEKLVECSCTLDDRAVYNQKQNQQD